MVQKNNTVQQTMNKWPYEGHILISTFEVNSLDEIFDTYNVIWFANCWKKEFIQLTSPEKNPYNYVLGIEENHPYYAILNQQSTSLWNLFT